MVAFEELLYEFTKDEDAEWSTMNAHKKRGFVLYVVDKMEIVNGESRRKAGRSLLYLAQGMYKEFDDVNECMEMMKENCVLLYNCGVYACAQQVGISRVHRLLTEVIYS